MLDRLSDLQFSVSRVEQIVDVFHVDLHEGDTDAPLFFTFILSEMIQHVVQGKGNQSLILPFDGL